ncbi:MAG: hypothetical protein ACQEXQ_22270 [Bacillota bacterium]
MNLIHLYNSGSKDIQLFNMLFIMYGVALTTLMCGLLKLTKQGVGFSRLLSGVLLVFVGTLTIFDVWFGVIKQFGQQIPSVAAGLLLILVGLSFASTIMFIATQKLLFKVKDITLPTVGFVAAQPVLAIIFFGILIVSGI